MKNESGKHADSLPTARTIRRACGNELYRTLKRLKTYVPDAKVKEAEELYVRRVMLNLLWIHEHRSDRKKLADWWEAEVASDIASLWEIDRDRLARAFRDAFGG
ncbi:dehydrogenase [Cohnella sp. GbtcB17]|uniref:dehydrogenase n=1 Tax=Cohnella sp. GbtcB17 TaxID=2824762 RepID=UPI001C2F610E|nr:dehydrogenase [Cohnella sp. GbtcB17]